jgi:hypothetical protein
MKLNLLVQPYLGWTFFIALFIRTIASSAIRSDGLGGKGP